MEPKYVMCVALAAASLVPAAARADGKVLPGAQHTPLVFVDDSSTLVRITDDNKGYRFHIEAVVGNVREHDRLRAEWTQNGKALATAKCSIVPLENPVRGGVECESNDAPLTAKGKVDVELIYTDDKQDKDYLVHTYHVTVAAWSLYPAKVTGYRVLPDDLLGPAWFDHTIDQHAEIAFWTSGATANATLRCAVDGKSVGEPFEASMNTRRPAGLITMTDRNAKGDTVEYELNNVRLDIDTLEWGTPDEIKANGGASASGHAKLIDHPGRWTCQLRADQKTIREFAFTVNAKGRVEQDEMNTGKGAIPTLDNIVMIENHIPKDAGFDRRIRPDAMKASFAFGQKWPDHPKVKAVQATYPPKGGSYPEPQ